MNTEFHFWILQYYSKIDCFPLFVITNSISPNECYLYAIIISMNNFLYSLKFILFYHFIWGVVTKACKVETLLLSLIKYTSTSYGKQYSFKTMSFIKAHQIWSKSFWRKYIQMDVKDLILWTVCGRRGRGVHSSHFRPLALLWGEVYTGLQRRRGHLWRTGHRHWNAVRNTRF